MHHHLCGPVVGSNLSAVRYSIAQLVMDVENPPTPTAAPTPAVDLDDAEEPSHRSRMTTQSTSAAVPKVLPQD